MQKKLFNPVMAKQQKKKNIINLNYLLIEFKNKYILKYIKYIYIFFLQCKIFYCHFWLIK